MTLDFLHRDILPTNHSNAMTPGQLARRVLGPVFPTVGRLYRRLFVDLRAVAREIPSLPPGSHMLDIGGGDGDLLNLYLPRHPGVSVTMIDLASTIGAWLSPELKDQVEILPETSIADYAAFERGLPDLILISDVVHHVPPDARPDFLSDLAGLVGPATRLFLKDVEPGSLRAKLNYAVDRYISGDPQVSHVAADDLRLLVEAHLPVSGVDVSGLIDENPPNYALIFSFS